MEAWRALQKLIDKDLSKPASTDQTAQHCAIANSRTALD